MASGNHAKQQPPKFSLCSAVRAAWSSELGQGSDQGVKPILLPRALGDAAQAPSHLLPITLMAEMEMQG